LKGQWAFARKKEEISLPSSLEPEMSALNIKDDEVAETAKALAKLKSTSITEAVKQALNEVFQREKRKAEIDREERERRVDEILERIRKSFPPDAPSWEEVMEDMYDEDGLPK
jgi:hypothetical protein